MNTSVQHPPHLSGTPEEVNLSVSQIPTPQWVSNLAKGISKRVGDFIEVMKVMHEVCILQEKQRKIEEIAIACEQSGNRYLASFGSLIRQNWNINEKNLYGDTALIYAAGNGYPEITQLLLAHPEIQVNEKRPDGWNALILAAYLGRTEITQLLLAHPEIQVNEKDSRGFTTLMYAAGNGRIEIIQLLLADQRLDLRIDDQWKQALKKAKTPEIKTLIEEAMKKQGIEF